MTNYTKAKLLFIFFCLCFACQTPSKQQIKNHDWPIRKADHASSSYSPLTQINKENVSQLQLAWEYKTGDEKLYTIECNPIIIDGILYASSPMLNVFALDAATGEEVWKFVPSEAGPTRRDGQKVNRGLTYWENGDDKRLYYPAGTYLYAINANDGSIYEPFGDGGRIDLTKDLDRDIGNTPVSSTSPPTIFEDLIIMCSSTPDGMRNTPPGHIRAYNLHTGEREWIFHTIPHPGEPGYETWPEEAWETAGGNNSWAGMSLDVEKGIVYAPTGSPAFDHNGFNRHGDNLYGNSVLALNARTGELIWHFQTVHHDLWDYDLASPPNLVSIHKDGKKIDAVVQVTKMGMLFTFDRETGEPIFPIEERPVPQSSIPGEQTAPTQPFPTLPPPYAMQGFTEKDITDLSKEAHDYVKETYFDKYGSAVLYPALSTKGDFIVPQFNGGTDWGGAAFDKETGILYVNASNEPEAITMLPAPEDAIHPYKWISSGHDELYDPNGFPISKRPWGTLNAIDLNKGEILWQRTLGTYPQLEKQGLPPTGTFNIGGPVVTAGGLVFIAATKDERIRAFDKDTGEVLWEYQMPAAGYATPSVYMVDGVQYVVIAAGGGGKPGTKRGDSYLAFKLSNLEN